MKELSEKMFKLKPYSAYILAFEGFLLIAMGVYFVLLRPPLLPEDYRYIATTFSGIHDTVPGLSAWLQKVFLVLSSYIFTTGLLIVFISFTSFRARQRGAFTIVALAGISSIVLMTVVNFIIGADFKWLLLLFTLPWAISLILYRVHK